MARVVVTRDPTIFAELIRRHQSHVRGWLGQLTRDPMLADDLAQDTFIRAWQKLHTFSGKGRFVSWLFKLAHNVFLQGLRKSKRDQQLAERVRTEVAAGETSSEINSELPDLPRVMAVLSEEEQQVMVLGFAYGLTHSEIQDVTDMPLGTVKSHIHRGKLKIREKFNLEELTRG